MSPPEDLKRVAHAVGEDAGAEDGHCRSGSAPCNRFAIVRSPVAGEVRIDGGVVTAEGVLVTAGETVAHVGEVSVMAPLSGWLLNWAPPGTRVEKGQFLLRIGS